MVTIERSQVERYAMRSRDPYWWADITTSLDGFLNIQSDYGDYAYRWSSFGADFRVFLIGCDVSYLIRKFGGSGVLFDLGGTVVRIRGDILRARRGGDIKAGVARGLWDELGCKELLWGMGGYTRDTFYADILGTDIPHCLYGDDYSSMPVCMGDDPQLVVFMERVWPHFVGCLRQEVGVLCTR